MSKNIIVAVVVVLFLIAISWVVITMVNKSGQLVSPVARSAVDQSKTAPSSVPAASAFNPPKEIHYDGSIDLQKELDSVNPQVLDSDFEE